MKKTQLYLAGFCIILIMASCNNGKKISNMAPLTIENNEIKTLFSATPDSSIDIAQLRKHYEQYPERWETAFKFLSEVDTSKLEFGRIDLSEDVYANFAEYTTQDIEGSVYESHKDYIDIQYVVSGQEYIALNNDTASLTVTKTYDKEKDYMNYAYDGAEMLLANNSRYFIFFPTDAHMPCIKVNEKGKVKKLVVKVKYN